MTATHDEIHADHHQMSADSGSSVSHRPRWLVPALAVGVTIAVALAISGVVAPGALLYVGLLAGCGLMHLFGHGGHGGHR